MNRVEEERIIVQNTRICWILFALATFFLVPAMIFLCEAFFVSRYIVHSGICGAINLVLLVSTVVLSIRTWNRQNRLYAEESQSTTHD